MSKPGKLLLLVLPLSILSNFYIVFKTHIQWEDGPDISVYGFPFYWITQQTWVNSLERQFYLLQLILNLTLFSLFYVALFYLTRFHKVTANNNFKFLILTVWVVCLIIIYPFLKEAYVCGWFPHWSIDDYSVLDRQLYWGIH